MPNMSLTCAVCKVCKFDTVEGLDNHQKICDGLYKEIFTCDICAVAQFDTFEEAVEHEKNCREDGKKNGLYKEVFTCDICMVAEFDTYEEALEHENQCREKKNGLYKEVFTCDVCHVAEFDTFEEALEHENQCREDNMREMRMEQSTMQQQLDQSRKQQERNTIFFVTIPPGRIGLTLRINKLLGGATVTKVEANSTTGGKIHVDDRIISIDNHQIVNKEDYAINQDKTRILEVSTARVQQTNPKSLKHALFTTNKTNNSTSDLSPGHALTAGNSSNIFTPSGTVNNTPTAYIHNYETKQLSINLRPVEIPFDPLDENFDNSLERELAWLIEESAIILPQPAQTSCASQPFILD